MSQITITGAGGLISREVVLIMGLLKSIGYNVSVEDEYTFNDEPFSEERYQELLKSTSEWNENPPKFDTFQCGKMAVHIKAVHIPWGG